MLICICILGIILVLSLGRNEIKFQEPEDLYEFVCQSNCLPPDELEIDGETGKITKYFFKLHYALEAERRFESGDLIEFKDLKFMCFKACSGGKLCRFNNFYYVDFHFKVRKDTLIKIGIEK